MERRTPHRIVRHNSYTDERLSPYVASPNRSTDHIPGYWRLVTVHQGRAHVRQYPHTEHDRALAHFGWFVTHRADATDFYASLENASGSLVDEFERRAGVDHRLPVKAHQIVAASMPNAPVGVL
jgi:hypothetical protein